MKEQGKGHLILPRAPSYSVKWKSKSIFKSKIAFNFIGFYEQRNKLVTSGQDWAKEQ